MGGGGEANGASGVGLAQLVDLIDPSLASHVRTKIQPQSCGPGCMLSLVSKGCVVTGRLSQGPFESDWVISLVIPTCICLPVVRPHRPTRLDYKPAHLSQGPSHPQEKQTFFSRPFSVN